MKSSQDETMKFSQGLDFLGRQYTKSPGGESCYNMEELCKCPQPQMSPASTLRSDSRELGEDLSHSAHKLLSERSPTSQCVL